VVLFVAEQTGGIRLRHPRSDSNDETGPNTAGPEIAALLTRLGLTSDGEWADPATPVLWRTAPEEVRPPGEVEFSAQVNRAVADIPDAIRDQIHAIHAEHSDRSVRDYLVDWIFFEAWRWNDGWVTDERGGARLGVFHDLLAQRVQAAMVGRLMGA
jgi:hypothetical protein